jgi:flagellar hook assembly protein FlgD
MEVTVLPNPFVNTVVINVCISTTCKVNVSVADSFSNQVIELFDDYLEDGEHSIFWDGRDDNDALVPSGEYYVSLTSNGINQTYKIVKY